MAEKSYSEFRSQIKPLDLVLFSGSDFVSSFIKYLEKKELKSKVGDLVKPGSFSHVGIIVTSEILDHPKVLPGKLYIFESTMSGKFGQGVYDINGKSFLGVQLRDFDQLLPKYLKSKDSKVALCHLLTDPLLKCNLEKIKIDFTNTFHDLNGIRYDANPIDLFASIFSCLRCCRKEVQTITGTDKWLFCSELVAIVYQHMGILSFSVNPQNVLPMDFVGYETDSIENGGIPIVVQLPPTYIKV